MPEGLEKEERTDLSLNQTHLAEKGMVLKSTEGWKGDGVSEKKKVLTSPSKNVRHGQSE